MIHCKPLRSYHTVPYVHPQCGPTVVHADASPYRKEVDRVCKGIGWSRASSCLRQVPSTGLPQFSGLQRGCRYVVLIPWESRRLSLVSLCLAHGLFLVPFITHYGMCVRASDAADPPLHTCSSLSTCKTVDERFQPPARTARTSPTSFFCKRVQVLKHKVSTQNHNCDSQ